MSTSNCLFIFFLSTFLIWGTGCREQFPKTISYDDHEFSFSGSPEDLCIRVNALRSEADSTRSILAVGHQRANFYDDFFGERLYFKTIEYRSVNDTIPVRTPDGDTIAGDPYRIMTRQVPVSDTQFINPDGYFRHPLTIYDSTSGRCDEIHALLRIDESRQKLILKLIRLSECTQSFKIPGGASAEPYMLGVLEEQLIDRLN